MDFQTRKNQLITEIKTVAERRAEKALADPGNKSSMPWNRVKKDLGL